MTSDESDLVYKPTPSFEEIKLQGEEGDESRIDELIERLESIKYRKKDGEEGQEEEADEDGPKDWIH